MEATRLEPGILAILILALHTTYQIGRWERELRKAARNCQYTRKQTAENKINELNREYDELLRKIRKGK